jgi:hypothetical protein
MKVACGPSSESPLEVVTASLDDPQGGTTIDWQKKTDHVEKYVQMKSTIAAVSMARRTMR